MHQNISLETNGVDRVHSLRIILTRLRGTNICTSSACFPLSFVRQPNGPECAQMVEMHQNVSLGANGLDRVRSLRKILTQLHGSNICTSSARFVPCFVMQPNGSESTQMVQNAPNRHFRVQWVGSGAFMAKNYDETSWHELLH